MKFSLLLSACLIAFPALAEVTPNKATGDSRVRVVEYNRDEVVKLLTFYGASTHIEFEPNEKIIDKGMGDEKGWIVKDSLNHLYLQPKAEFPDTNITVVTDQRTYNFLLVLAPLPTKDPNSSKHASLVFDLRFKYPEKEAQAIAAQAKSAASKADQKKIRSKLSGSLTEADELVDNFDYWVAGSDPISPTAARDDGRFIYLTFSKNRDFPSVYVVDDEGNEALINTSVVSGNTIVVQRMARQLMLRKGNMVVSVLNKSFDPDGGEDNETGTASPDVLRVTKGADQ